MYIAYQSIILKQNLAVNNKLKILVFNSWSFVLTIRKYSAVVLVFFLPCGRIFQTKTHILLKWRDQIYKYIIFYSRFAWRNQPAQRAKCATQVIRDIMVEIFTIKCSPTQKYQKCFFIVFEKSKKCIKYISVSN